jgi:hypothetical protein
MQQRGFSHNWVRQPPANRTHCKGKGKEGRKTPSLERYRDRVKKKKKNFHENE